MVLFTVPALASHPAPAAAEIAAMRSATKKARSLVKTYRKQLRAATAADTNTIMLAVLCFLLPPLAVYFKEGMSTGKRFWISLLLTLIVWVPGVVYALLVILDKI